MPIIRKQLKPSDVYPDDIRYNSTTGTVQTNVNGNWVDSPDADPRHRTTFPPRITADTACDAAQSVTDALQGQIDSIIVAIDNATTAFAIAGLILGLLSFGVFAIFISIALFLADQMIAAGSTSLNAALTPAVYDQLKCILYCNMNDQGRLSAEAMDTVQLEVANQIGGLAATVLNGMLSLAGEGGVNNLAALGTSTGDCDDCECSNGCPEKYEIWTATHPGSPYGTIIGTGENYIDVQSSVTHFVILKAIDINDCCWVNSITTLTGTLTPAAHLNCGQDFSGSFIPTTPVGGCRSYIQLQGDGTARVFLDECP